MELPRGIRDIEPEEYKYIEKVRSTFLDTVKIFDFNMMEPASIEMLSTLEAKSGPMIKNEIYAFKDKGERDIALRFDLTVGMTRYITNRRDISIPIKLASFASVWRYDEPQLGRYRWFYQWDIEIYDNFNIESDAEIIEFTDRFLRKLGLEDIRIEISDRAMLEKYLKDKGIVKIDEYLRAIDKLSKKSKDEILDEYKLERLDEILEFVSNKFTIDRLIDSKMDSSRIEELLDSLNTRGVKNVSINPSIVRGLDYYSGIVFEVFSKGKNAIVGGGRYDKLTEVFKRRDIGATGAAGGVERIVALLKREEIRENKVFIAYINEAFKKRAIEMASQLRRANIITTSEISKRNLKRQLEYALKNRYTHAIILAEKELANDKIIFKNLINESEEVIDREEFINNPYSYIKR